MATSPSGASEGNAQFNNLTLGGLLYESSLDAIVAHAGGGQANATPLVYEVNRVTTVANPGDSVLLPPSAAGLTVILINNGANPMQVYGSGNDTIDGVASATGVSQMQGSNVIYVCTTAGAWTTNGIGTGYAGSLPTVSSTNGIPAAGTNQATATPLTTVMNRVTTTPSGSGVLLPPSAPGLQITVYNAGANALLVYGAGSDQINGAASFSIAAGKNASFGAAVAGQWHAILSA